MSTTQPMDLYDARPDLYDVMHADHVDDMRLVQEYAGLEREGARVLELGCGTGRLMVPLLDAGMQVVGVDREAAMLEVARERLAPYGERAELVEGDMCRFSVPGLFDMALVGLNPFMQLL